MTTSDLTYVGRHPRARLLARHLAGSRQAGRLYKARISRYYSNWYKEIFQ